MVNPPFATGHFYHIYNRGVEKRDVFLTSSDYKRFLQTINYYRLSPQPVKFSDYKRSVKRFLKTEEPNEAVKIYCYCLMPNHFHLLIQQTDEFGITQFMRKISDSYTKYFNTKYKRVGPLFQGAFKAKLIESEEYLLQLSKYIHRNSFPLKMWEAKVYPYSSYSYYLSGEVHEFCEINFIRSFFRKNNSGLDYKSFVEELEIEDPEVFKLAIDVDDYI